MENKEIIDIEFKESTVEGEEGVELPQESMIDTEPKEEDSAVAEKSLEERIKEKINASGYAYVYDGEILDESKLTFNSKTYCIFNKNTGLPFIYDGVIVRFGGTIEAMAALNTLKMFTGNDNLGLMDYEELRGKSML